MGAGRTDASVFSTRGIHLTVILKVALFLKPRFSGMDELVLINHLQPMAKESYPLALRE